MGEIRHALRLMRRSPGFTAVSVVSVALGIGANTAIFSLMNTILLKTLAVARPSELVEILRQYPGNPRGNGYYGWDRYERFRDTGVFSALTGTAFDNLARIRTEGGEEETVVEEIVYGNYFSVLGLRPAMGRLLGPADLPGGRGESAVVVVSWSFWLNRMGGDPAAVGKRVFESGQAKTVVGVLPREYVGPRVGSRTDVWMAREPGEASLVGRLRPGMTIERARAQLAPLFRTMVVETATRSKDPNTWRITWDLDWAGSGFSGVRDRYGKPLLLLLTVVGALLLLACINVASMLLARTAGRQREFAVRVGLGASRGRLVRQMLLESGLLSAAGTLLGVGLAYAGTVALVRIVASGRPFERIRLEVTPDWRVLLFTVAIGAVTGVLFGLAPAWHAFLAAPAGWLRQTGKGGETRGWRFFGRSLVSAQVALSILLVTAAGVLLDHLSRLRNEGLGFRRDHVLLIQLDPSRSGYSRAQLAGPYRGLLQRLEAMPGVRAASVTGCSPIQGCGASRFVLAEGNSERAENRRRAGLMWVAPRYFETLGIPLLAGRDFALSDVGRPRVAVISESMAKRHFPGLNPLGRRIWIDREGHPEAWYGSDDPYEVVGLVGDVRGAELREPAPPFLYFNMFQEDRITNQVMLRTTAAPESVVADARRLIQEELKGVAVSNVTTLSDQVDAAIVPERLIAMLTGYFGALAIVLAGIGMYGLLAYTVARRVNEIGVRMALGATMGSIARLVVGDAGRMVAAGSAAGALLAAWSRPVVMRLVVDLKAPGWGAMAAGAAIVAAAAIGAAYWPARRAARIDPMAALRHE
jgi:predicted permease